MSNVKIISIRRNSVGTMIKRIITTPKKVNVIAEGLRGADHANIYLSAEHDVQQGDEIYYLQDHIDLDNLRGMWNFYGSFRDESGFEQDDNYSGTYSLPACVNGMVSLKTDLDFKHSGYYKFKINANVHDGVEIVKKFGNNDTSAGRTQVMDMAHNFDLFLHVKPTSNTGANTTIWDDYDTATSKGLKVQIDTTLNTVTITANATGGTDNVMVASGITTLNTVSLIRVTRKGGEFRLFINNIEKSLTNSLYSGNLNNLTNIRLFKEYNDSTSSWVANTHFEGNVIQIRFYNTALPDSVANKIHVSKPISTTMKFGGKIWKINDVGLSKKLYAVSFGKELLNTNISSKTFKSTPTDTFSSGGARKNNVYYATSNNNTADRVDLDMMVTDILKFVDSGVYAYFQKEPDTSFQSDFIAEGTLLDILKVLLIMDSDNHIFNVLPRKVLFINREVQTNYIISDQNFDVLESGKDDTNTTNSIITTGRLQKLIHEFTKSNLGGTAGNWTADVELTAPPFGYKAVIDRIITVTRDGTEIFSTSDGQVNPSNTSSSAQFKFDSGDSTIKFWCIDSNTHNYVIKFYYYYTLSNVFSNVQFKDDSGSIGDNGLYHRNITVPQIVNGIDIYLFNEKYLENFKNVVERITVSTSKLINSLNVGQKVSVFYLTENLGSIDENNVITPVNLVVKSIEYNYPESITKIELGEYQFSGFDVEKQSADNLRTLDIITGAIRTE